MSGKKRKKYFKYPAAVLLASLAGAMLLTGCTGQTSSEGFFGYQEKPSEVTGIWCEGDSERGVGITFDGGGNISVSFTSPDTLSGITFMLENSVPKAICGEMTVELSGESARSLLRLSRLFSLREEDIESVKAADDGCTEAHGSGDGYTWTVITDSEGIPCEIRYTENGIESVLTVENIKLNGQ